MVFIIAIFAISPIVMAIGVIGMDNLIAIVAGGVMIRIAGIAYDGIIITIIFTYPIAAVFAVISMAMCTAVTPPFIQILDVLETIRIGIFPAIFAVG